MFVSDSQFCQLSQLQALCGSLHYSLSLQVAL